MAIALLSGAFTASAWWAAAIWGYKLETIDLTALWIIPGIATLFIVWFMIYEAVDE
jgi:hypothetical protein